MLVVNGSTITVDLRRPAACGRTNLLGGVGGRLAGRWGAPVSLIPTGPVEFYIGFMRGGELFDVGDEMTVRMVVEGKRATAIEMVWQRSRVFAAADRAEGEGS